MHTGENTITADPSAPPQPTMIRDGIEFVDFRKSLNLCWKGREDDWQLVGTIRLSQRVIMTTLHEHAADQTDYTIEPGVYPIIRHHSRYKQGYRLSCPMLSSRSVFRSSSGQDIRVDPEIYWPDFYHYELAAFADRGWVEMAYGVRAAIELAPGWAVKSEGRGPGWARRRWFEKDGQRVELSGA